MTTAVVNSRMVDFDSTLRPGANFAGSTPAHYAVLGGQEEIIELLIKAGENYLEANEGISVTRRR